MISNQQLIELMQPKTRQQLSALAATASQQTRRQHGYSIELYAPIYLSNHCVNRCQYCSFRSDNPSPRTKLDDQQLIEQAEILSQRGIDHVLMVTGEHPKKANINDFLHWLSLLKRYFHSVSIESQQLTRQDYQALTEAGLNGVYLYQETYFLSVYQAVHLGGLKADYQRRLQAPWDMLSAGVRKIGLGILLGLHDDWRGDFTALLLEARRLRQAAKTTAISISLPRLQPSPVFASQETAAMALLQMVCVARLYEPTLAITLSTREPEWIRDLLLPYGITSASVDSSTRPGGYRQHDKQALAQFSTSDQRSTEVFLARLTELGLQPVAKDWDRSIG